MKIKNIILSLAVGAATLAMTSCNLTYFPSDELNSDSFLQNDDAAKYIIDGCYGMLKDQYAYIRYASGNSYVRHYTQLAEFPSDNICNSNRTSDPLYEANTLKMISTLNNNSLLWWIGYKICFSANQVIEKYPEGESTSMDQLLGEAYFLRGMMHFHLCCFFAKPYSFGRDNLGVVIRTSTNTSETHRATVGECYDQVVLDLQKAASLLGNSRGNSGYASKQAALGLLSRVYLYMEENDKVISTVNEMLGGADPASVLDGEYETYFANAPSRKETLFCVYHDQIADKRGQESIGSMYLHDDEQSIGWGEIYPSAPLMNLYERYPEDIRLSYIRPNVYKADNKRVYFPGLLQDDACRLDLSYDVSGSEQNGYTFKDENGKTYRVMEELVNGEYKQYYVNWEGNGAAEKLPARITSQMYMASTASVPMYYVTKFSYQGGDAMMASPVFLRWGEVILNRAEAYAKLGKTTEALADVNVIRTRARIPAEGMFSSSKMHGYTDVLDIVLDERRMELAFEGHRMWDLIRNHRSVDRRYSGVQIWEVIDCNDNRIQYPIPFDETSTSGIQQNPGY